MRQRTTGCQTPEARAHVQNRTSRGAHVRCARTCAPNASCFPARTVHQRTRPDRVHAPRLHRTYPPVHTTWHVRGRAHGRQRCLSHAAGVAVQRAGATRRGALVALASVRALASRPRPRGAAHSETLPRARTACSLRVLPCLPPPARHMRCLVSRCRLTAGTADDARLTRQHRDTNCSSDKFVHTNRAHQASLRRKVEVKPRRFTARRAGR